MQVDVISKKQTTNGFVDIHSYVGHLDKTNNPVVLLTFPVMQVNQLKYTTSALGVIHNPADKSTQIYKQLMPLVSFTIIMQVNRQKYTTSAFGVI